MAVLLALGCLVGLPTAPAAALTTPDGPAPVTLTLTELSPTAPTPGGTLTVAGVVTNAGPAPRRGVTVQLAVSDRPVTSRSQLAALAGDDAEPSWPSGSPTVPVGEPVPVTTLLPPGGRVTFRLTVDTDTLGLRGFGVYPFSVGVSDGMSLLASVHTFLPWSARTDGYDPTSLVWLWPLVTAPRRDATGTTVGAPVSAELTPDARLGRLVAAVTDTPVTWVVDPDLLTAAAAAARQRQPEGAAGMPTGPRPPATPTGAATSPAPGATPTGAATTPDAALPATTPDAALPNTTTPAGSPSPESGLPTAASTPDPQAADEWLRLLRRNTLGRPLVQLPYADPDVTALAHAGLGPRLRPAREEGAAVVADVLGRTEPTYGAVAWPADGMLDAATARTLAGAGFTGVVLDPATLPDAQVRTYTATGRVDVRTPAGVLRGVVADSALSALLTGPPDAGGTVLTVQRFLAETAMITAERPNQTRTVLVVPPREWAPPGDLAAALLAAIRQAPWVQLTGVGRMLTAPPERTIPAADLTYPRRARAAELPAHLLTQAAGAQERAAGLVSALIRPAKVVDGVRRAAQRLTAVHWREDPQAAGRLAARLTDHVATLYAGIRVTASPLVLSGRAGTFPVTVINDLDQPIQVRVRLTPDAGRIRVQAAGRLVPVAARRRTQVNIPVEAVANGEVTVLARLATPTGRPLGEPVQVTVRVAQIGPVGLVVTVGAAVVLFTAAGVQLIRRVRRR